MCTSSPECKTVMTVVLTVKSGMNPHMICQDSGGFGNDSVWFGLVRVGHSVTLWCDRGYVFQLELEYLGQIV
jgi:hypothetical protein